MSGENTQSGQTQQPMQQPSNLMDAMAPMSMFQHQASLPAPQTPTASTTPTDMQTPQAGRFSGVPQQAYANASPQAAFMRDLAPMGMYQGYQNASDKAAFMQQQPPMAQAPQMPQMNQMPQLSQMPQIPQLQQFPQLGQTPFKSQQGNK